MMDTNSKPKQYFCHNDGFSIPLCAVPKNSIAHRVVVCAKCNAPVGYDQDLQVYYCTQQPSHDLTLVSCIYEEC